MATTFFIFSMIVILSMLFSKIFEIKSRKMHFLSNLFMKGDQRIKQFLEKFNLEYKRYKKIVHIFIFDFLPSYLYELLVKMKDYVAKKYYESANDFRGRRVLKNTGSVSSFLERLSEDKQNIADPQI